MFDTSLARAVHVLALIHWIGGVAFVTLVILPLARRRANADEGFAFFENVERRFAAQVRVSIALAGAAGFWMTYRMDLWERFAELRFWWMSAMVGVWLVFALLVYVVEPLAHVRLARLARRNPASALRWLTHTHAALLALLALTALGAVVGAQGISLF